MHEETRKGMRGKMKEEAKKEGKKNETKNMNDGVFVFWDVTLC
jgi:hypothetical protein